MKKILIVLFIISIAFTAWEFPNAEYQYCFNLSSDGNMLGRNQHSFYTSALVDIPNNNSLLNGDMFIYSNATQYHIRLIRNDSENATIMFPIANNIASGDKVEYCIYGGEANMNTIRYIVPYSLSPSYYPYSTFLPALYSNCIVSVQGNYLNVTSSGICGMNVYSSGTWGNTRIFTKMIPISGSPGTGTSSLECSGAYYIKAMTATSYGSAVYYRQDTGNIGSIPEACYPTPSFGTSSFQRIYYDENYSITSTSSADSQTGATYYFNPIIYMGGVGSALYEYATLSYISEIGQNFTAEDIFYDTISTNITINSPTINATYQMADTVLVSTTYNNDFDNCSVYLDGTQLINFTSISIGQAYSGFILEQDRTFGENEIMVSCYKDNNEEHKYVYINNVGANPEELFNEAFGISVGSLCSSAILDELTGCTESYRINNPISFGAVVCPEINGSMDFSCTARGYYTKNNYTIFYPITYNYSGQGGINETKVEHIGALFYYNNLKIDTGIEIHNSSKFIYIPAQNRPRDCGVEYNPNWCSYWEGFIVNTKTIYISNRENLWFAAGGPGYTSYTQNLSQAVIDVNVVPVSGLGNISDTGFYTRISCLNYNGTYQINIRSTIQRLYSLTVSTPNLTISTTVNASTLVYNIPITSNSSYILVSGDGEQLCQYGDGSVADQGLFVPFRFPFADGFGKFFIYIIMLFAVVVSVLIPYGLFGVVIINDIYGILDITQMAFLAVFVVIGAFVNNVNLKEKGLRHLVVILAIVLGYLATLQTPYLEQTGLDVASYTNLLLSAKNLMHSNGLVSFTIGLANFIIQLFMLIIFLPIYLTDILFFLINMISPTLATGLSTFKNYLAVGGMIYFYLKAYEVLSNRFKVV